MRSFLIAFLFFISFRCFSQAKDTLPRILEVVKTFYSEYSLDSLSYRHAFFEKRPEGWFVVSKKWVENELVEKERFIFFRKGARAYEKLPWGKAGTFVDEPSAYIDPHDVEWFNSYPYYGYAGWYKDALKDLESKSQPTETDLYLLARSYSQYANSLLSDQFGFALSEEMFKIPLRINSLNDEQIKKYENISNKAIAFFAAVKKRNPSFPTIVGDITVKYANEVMVPFHNLMLYRPDYAKKIKLPDELYPDSVLDVARVLLDDCPENSIFISFGDNDFYPLLYLQHHARFRRDVYVVNYYILGLPQYIFGYTQPLFDAAGVSISADTSMYRGRQNDYMYIGNETGDLPFDSLINLMKRKKQKDILTVPNRDIIVHHPLNPASQNLTISIDATHLFRNHWILLDILHHLRGRPIIFANQLTDQLQGLNKFLEYTGYAFKFRG